jgi:hypothetical protein
MSAFNALGLDGSNPLHALAALGVLRLGDRLNPGLRMRWLPIDGGWRPAYTPVQDAAGWIQEMAQGIRKLAELGQPDPALNRKVRELSAQLKKALDERKIQERSVKAQASAEHWPREERADRTHAALAPIVAQIDRIQRERQTAEATLQAANGLGIAHVGDAIGVDTSTFRRVGQQAMALWPADVQEPLTKAGDAALMVAQWPALGCDAIDTKGKVVPTPYSFSNGSGGQYLLKDFRACASRVTPPLLEASLLALGNPTVDDATSLNWDPADQVSHALVWQDPQARAKATDVAANALAYLGLSMLPCAPGPRGLEAVGWTDGGGFVWPIWKSSLGIDQVIGLLATMPRRPPWRVDELRARGVEEVRHSAKINPNEKRKFFAPSRPLA